MSIFLSRHLRSFSVVAIVTWVAILAVAGFAFATSTWTFQDSAYYAFSVLVAVAIVLSTLVLLGVQEWAGRRIGDPIRGAGLLGFIAAALALAFLWFVPGWAGLFVWAVASTLVRTRTAEPTSGTVRGVVYAGLALVGVAIGAAAIVAVTGDALGAALFGALAVLAASLIVWHSALAAGGARVD